MNHPVQFDHKFRQLAVRTISLFAALALAGSAMAGEAEDKCSAAIAKAGAKHFSTTIKTLSKCELSRSSGKLPDTDNCRPSVGAIDDLKTQEKLDKSSAKLAGALTKACAGVDVADLVNAPPCDAPSDLDDLATCLADDAYAADADSLIGTIFGTTLVPIASSGIA